MTSSEKISRQAIIRKFDEVFDYKLFKTLSEPVRIRILEFLMLNGRADIESIAKELPQDRSVISRHCQLMHDAGILICEKVSRHKYYSIDGQHFIDQLEKFLNQIKESISLCCPNCCK
jgi:DNA-binding transcriptional ArsR family regulator